MDAGLPQRVGYGSPATYLPVRWANTAEGLLGHHRLLQILIEPNEAELW